MKKEFNLIDEPWVCVRTYDNKIKEVNLKDVIINSHEYIELAGETKTQDFAIFRLILAIIYTVFSRYDENGNETDIDNSMDTWENIWYSKRIPSKPIEKYLSKYYERFWLFNDDCPFYQSTSVKGNEKLYSTSKMIGSLFESGNKPRLFSERFNKGILLSYAEATRWLIHINCFDDIAAKKPTPRKTWVSQLGLIAIKGDNLFETIMLNYNAECDYTSDDFSIDNSKKEVPSWELDNNSVEFNHCITVPDNQAGLLSLMSRRVYLCRENNLVNGYYISGGDYFDEQQVFQEQMTLWLGYKDKKSSEEINFKPKRYDTSKKIWQEFGTIATISNNNGQDNTSKGYHCVGVIKWINTLKSANILEDDYIIKVTVASVIYDDKQSASLPVIDLISDNLTFHSKLLVEVGFVWNEIINEEIGKCEKVANQLVYLSKRLKEASGASDNIYSDDVKVQFYDKIDRIFRKWLSELNPTEDIIDEYNKKLDEQVYKIAISFGNQLVNQTDSRAIFGRNSLEISSAKELNIFYQKIAKILNIKKS